MSADVMSEMQLIVRAAAQPAAPGESVKAVINRIARNLGIGHRRAKAYWYGEVRMIPVQEADRLRAWYRKHVADRHARLSAELKSLEGEMRELGI